MLKKDNWILGIVMGLLLPVVVFFVILFALKTWGTVNGQIPIRESTLQLVAIFTNLFTFRYYMVKLKYDKTGRGILLTTFIFAGIYFYLNM